MRVEVQHLRERRDAAACVADGHPHAEAAEPLQGGGELRVLDEGGGDGKLEDEARRRLTGHLREERARDHGRGGDVQREEARLGKLVELGDGQLEGQALEFDGEPDRRRIGEPASGPGVTSEA